MLSSFKIPILAFLAYIVVLSSTTTTITLAQSPPVLDTTGQPLYGGIHYYIQPVVPDVGGGLALINRNGSCPLHVGLHDAITSYGLPITFTPCISDDTIILESMDFTIQSLAITNCIGSTWWAIDETGDRNGRRLITTGGDKKPDYFQIEKVLNTNVYNLVWCPWNTPEWPRCGRFGILNEDGMKLLALDGSSALPVVFKRAS